MNTQDIPTPPVHDKNPSEMKADGWIFLCAEMFLEEWDNLNLELPRDSEVAASQTFGQEGVNFWYRVHEGVAA